MGLGGVSQAIAFADVHVEFPVLDEGEELACAGGDR